MYIEQLQTPHPNHAKPGEITRPLLDALDLPEARRCLDTARRLGHGAYRQALTHDVLPHVQEEVRRSLWYDDTEAPEPGPYTTPLDTLQDTQTTYCYGYALVTSECMKALGVDHWLAMTGDHACLTAPLPTDAGRMLYLVESLKPTLNDNITGALRKANSASMEAEMADAAHPRGVAMLDLTVLAGRKGCETTRELLQEYRWLAYKRSEQMDIHTPGNEETRTLVISTFAPHIGSKVLQHTAEFRAATERGQFDRAADALAAIPGLYPDIDARAPRQLIFETIKGLCAAGDFVRASKAITNYCASFARTIDPRPKELEGDLWAIVAKHLKSPDLRAKAAELYEIAKRHTRLVDYATALDHKIYQIRHGGNTSDA